MNLRRVERSGEEKKRDVGSDVASILKRRIAVEISDTESDSDDDDSDSDWSTWDNWLQWQYILIYETLIALVCVDVCIMIDLNN